MEEGKIKNKQNPPLSIKTGCSASTLCITVQHLLRLVWIDCANSEWIWRTLSSDRKKSHRFFIILKLRICKAAAALPAIPWGWGMVVPNLGCDGSAANQQTQVTRCLRAFSCWKQQHLSANPNLKGKLIPQSLWGSWNNTPMVKRTRLHGF